MCAQAFAQPLKIPDGEIGGRAGRGGACGAGGGGETWVPVTVKARSWPRCSAAQIRAHLCNGDIKEWTVGKYAHM